jgi:hypothetical protein
VADLGERFPKGGADQGEAGGWALVSAPRPRGGHPATAARSVWGSGRLRPSAFCTGRVRHCGEERDTGGEWWLTTGARMAERQGDVGRW